MADRLRAWAGWQDLAALHEVCSRRLRASPGRAFAHPGDISWWLGWPPKTADELARRVTLWEHDDELIGFALLDEKELITIVDPGSLDTEASAAFEDEMVARAARAVRGPLRVAEFEDEVETVERWRARGFLPIDEGYQNFVRDLDPDADLGAGGIDVASVADDDVGDRASVTHAAFGEPGAFQAYVADYAVFRASPAYPDGWDLLARTQDGRPAACCIAWPDPSSAAGTLEPVATHPGLARQGYGRAVLREGFRRLAAAGMRTAIIGAENGNDAAEALYRSEGFIDDHTLRIYERP